MGIPFTPPIDLYAETLEEGFDKPNAEPPGSQNHPRDNGELDEPAVVAGEHRLETVLGW